MCTSKKSSQLSKTSLRTQASTSTQSQKSKENKHFYGNQKNKRNPENKDENCKEDNNNYSNNCNKSDINLFQSEHTTAEFVVTCEDSNLDSTRSKSGDAARPKHYYRKEAKERGQSKR